MSRALQMILHLPLITLVIFPANATKFFEISLKIAMFDFLEQLELLDSFGLKFEEDKVELPSQI